MSPVKFPEANCVYGPPPGLDQNQVRAIAAYQGEIVGGSCDGLKQVVVCYWLQPFEIEQLQKNGGMLFISMIGGLAPHYPSLSFHDATHPA